MAESHAHEDVGMAPDEHTDGSYNAARSFFPCFPIRKIPSSLWPVLRGPAAVLLFVSAGRGPLLSPCKISPLRKPSFQVAVAAMRARYICPESLPHCPLTFMFGLVRAAIQGKMWPNCTRSPVRLLLTCLSVNFSAPAHV